MISRHWRLMVMATWLIAGLAIGAIGTARTLAQDDQEGQHGHPGVSNVQQIFNETPGPLPLSGPFTSNGGTLVIFASGSGFTLDCLGANSIGMDIFVDDVQFGTAQSFTNEACSHKAFVSNALVVTGVGKGPHTLALVALDTTSTDFNDFYSVTVMETERKNGD